MGPGGSTDRNRQTGTQACVVVTSYSGSTYRGNRRPPFSLEQTTLARVETHTANLTYTPLPYTLSRQLRLSNPKEWTQRRGNAAEAL